MAHVKKVLCCLLISVLCFGVSSSVGNGNGEVFDFIIVGGGTAGCVVGRRLAEGGGGTGHSVLIIELGGIPNPNLTVPGLAPDLWEDPNTVIVHHTVPQSNAGLSRNGVITFPSGRTLGGGSSVNGMFFNRGSPHDYNNWASLTGDNSWSYSSLLKYFRKIETYLGFNPSDQHGFHGPISITLPYFTPGLAQWLAAGSELGYPIADPNGPQKESFTVVNFSQDMKKRRVSAFRGYIEPILKSAHPIPDDAQSLKGRNLRIYLNSEVNRIIFEGNRAVGVKFTTTNSNGKRVVRFANARKEIIVSAGAIGSPVILMKSGVGPKSVLDEGKIPAVKYLPVGKNLQDHPGFQNAIILGNRSVAIQPDQDYTPENWLLYENTGNGPFSSMFGFTGQAFLTSSVLPSHQKSLGWSDIHLFPGFYNSPPSFVTDIREWETASTWDCVLGRPKSRGTVTLNKTDNDGTPLIDFQYYNHPDDLQVVVEAVKFVVNLCENTKAFQGLGCRISSNPFEACKNLEFRSDSYWKCFVRQNTVSMYHPAGSCRMGRGPDDTEAVVDAQLRVIGVDALRVVDASIMPAVTNANTQAPVYLIAEKAADMILHAWGATGKGCRHCK